MSKLLKTIKLKATEPALISEASDVLTGYIDSDFKNYGLDKDTPAEEKTVELYKMIENGIFKQIFTQPEKQWMTQGQVIEFVKNHKEDLKTSYGYTFFLLKKNGVFFVAFAYLDGHGRPGVYVRRFDYDFVWGPEFGSQFVVLQLDSKTPSSETSESLTLGSLDSRIKELENQVESLRKFLVF